MLILGFATFLLFGCQLVIVGAYQPQLTDALGVGLREIGLLGAAIVAGIGIGVVCAGPLADRRPGRPLFVGSVLLTATALLTVGRGMGFERAALHLFVAGLGAGFYETVVNATVVSRYAEDSVRRLSFVHSAATLGGMLAPLAILAWVDRGGDYVDGFRVLGGAHAAVALWGMRADVFSTSPHASVHPANEAGIRAWITRPAIVGLIVAAFFYVGAETCLTLFVIPYTDEVLGLSADRGRTAISAFWLGLLAMRVAVMLAPRPAGVRTLFWTATVGTLVLGAGIALRFESIELLLGAVGLAMGAQFPLFVALSGQAVPEARATAVAIVVGLGGAGGFLLPWGLGIVGDDRGPTAVMLGVAIGCAISAVAALSLVRTLHPVDPSQPLPSHDAHRS